MNKKRGFYTSLVALPDRLYPFSTEVGGRRVRGIRSYNAAFAKSERKYGRGHYGFKLNAYRQLFHFVCSIILIVAAVYVLQYDLGSTRALYTFLIAGVLFISFQEFYLHRRLYQQLWRKGILDWLSWCIPVGIYFFTHFH